MRRGLAVLVALGVLTFMGKSAGAFDLVFPGNSPLEVLRYGRTSVAHDPSTNTYYALKGIDGFCTLKRTEHQFLPDRPSRPGFKFLSSVETVEGSCVYPPSPTRQRTMIPVRAVIENIIEISRTLSASSSDTAFSERLFEMFVTDGSDPYRTCVASVSVMLPTGRRLSADSDFIANGSCNFDQIPSRERSSVTGVLLFREQ